MRLLILGGTRFVGWHLTRAALAAGHEVTLFHRGTTTPLGAELDARRLDVRHGDRDGGLDALGDDRWDAVIDTCGYVPRVVGASARALADRVEHYTFVSTVSVYPDFDGENLESEPVPSLDDGTETIDGDTYGPLKVACERAVDEVLPGRALHVRPGLVVGPFDHTDRFAYWPVRIAAGGRVLAPGRRGATIQIIDARDLAAWTLRATEDRLVGAFNAVGPERPLTMQAFLETAREVCNPDAGLVWLDDDTLEQAGVEPWTGLPLWIPGVDTRTSNRKAIEAGLTLRPLEETLRDTLAWARSLPEARPFEHCLPREREAELIAASGR